MIQSIRKSKWLALLKLPAHVPTQSYHFQCTKYMSITTTVSRDSTKSSFNLSDLIKNIKAARIPASVKRRLECSDKPKQVVEFLQDFNFSETQIKAMVSRWPLLLLSNTHKVLKPKLEFLSSKGLSGDEIFGLMVVEPYVILRSLEHHLIPLFSFLEDVVGNEENAAKVIKRYPFIFRSNVSNNLKLNVETLQSSGVSETRIPSLMLNNARAIAAQPARFDEAVKMVKEMKIGPADTAFGFAIDAVCWCSTEGWERKLNILKSYGMSYDEFLVGFRKQPMIMIFKDENLKLKMDFFVNNLCWRPSKVVKTPWILLFGLGVRTVPRLSVLHVLVSKGLVTQVSSVQSFLKLTNTKFVEKFVKPYEDKVPEVLEAHQGKLKIQDWSSVDINPFFMNNDYVSYEKTELGIAS